VSRFDRQSVRRRPTAVAVEDDRHGSRSLARPERRAAPEQAANPAH
jgi:hypothetical protein